MKIYTLTYNCPEKDNYGQILQCYALLKFLNNLGHDAKYLQYTPCSWHKRTLSGNIRRAFRVLLCPIILFQKLKEQKKQATITAYQKEHYRGFGEFIDKYIPQSSRRYNTIELLKNPPDADAFICGSDQIWANYDPGYFLDFVPKGVKRIAYAPSNGGRETNKTGKAYIREAIKTFSFISCREQSGVDMCSELGRPDACVVPDPTLLLDATVYRDLEVDAFSCSPKPYIFLYLLGSPINIEVSEILNFVKQNGYDVKYVASQGRIDDFSKIDATAEEWIEMIDKADYVITNSFHGTVFSLIFNKQFIALPLVGKLKATNVRLYDLLEKYSLLERICEGNLNVLFDKIDFSSFNKNVKKEKENIKQLISELS